MYIASDQEDVEQIGCEPHNLFFIVSHHLKAVSDGSIDLKQGAECIIHKAESSLLHVGFYFLSFLAILSISHIIMIILDSPRSLLKDPGMQ